MTRVVGPYGFSDQDPEGFMIEGFEHGVTLASYYNFEWMPKLVEAAGYVKDIDYFVYKIDIPKEMPEFYKRIYERAQKKGEFEIVEFTTKKQLKPCIRPILNLMNETYMQNNIYGYAPLDEKEQDELAKKYLPILDPRFIKAVRKDGEIVAFVIGMPDMTAGIRKARGRLFPFGILFILRAAKKTKQLDLMLGRRQGQVQGDGPRRDDGRQDDRVRPEGGLRIHGHPPRDGNQRQGPGRDGARGRQDLQEIPRLPETALTLKRRLRSTRVECGDEGRPFSPRPPEPVPAVPPSASGGPPSATGGFRAAFTPVSSGIFP